MKNKILLCACSLAVLVGMLSSCKKEADVLGISQSIANKTMLGVYTYTAIDSASMQVFKKECALKKDNAGNQTGYYRESMAGQGAGSDVSIPLTWTAEKAADNLSMNVTMQLGNGTTKTFVWADGVIREGKQEYPKSLSGLSEIDTQNSIYENLENKSLNGVTYTYHEHLDTVPYLAWKTTVEFVAPADTAARKAEILQSLEEYTDTIIWFLRTQVAEHRLDRVCLDTVIAGEDTSYVLVDLVYIEPKASEKDRTKGKHGVTYLVSEIKKRVDQLNDRPATSVRCALEVNRVNNENTAAYAYEYHEWSKEFYTNPDSEKATAYDSLYTFNAKGWAVSTITNSKKFGILLSGNEQTLLKEQKAGTETRNQSINRDGVFTTLSISGFDTKKGEAVINDEVKCKLQ